MRLALALLLALMAALYARDYRRATNPSERTEAQIHMYGLIILAAVTAPL